MERIDMSDKFFHAIKWDCNSEHVRLITLRKILQDGQILSKYDQTHGEDNSYIDKKIFLSVYPTGLYVNSFSGRMTSAYSSFDMTRSTFYLILSSKIKNDFNTISGSYPYECLVDGPISLKKYLVGIGNAGYDIDRKLIFCYLYTMFLKGKITQVELYKKLKEAYFPLLLDHKDVAEFIESVTKFASSYQGNTDYNEYIAYSLSKNADDLIDKGSYDSIKETFTNHDMPVHFFDNSGHSVEPEKQLVKVLKMQRYIKNNAAYKSCPK